MSPESTATAIIGSNSTSVNSSATLTANPSVITNPDFYSSADPWLCSRYSAGNLGCYWLSSDTGASGGVAQIYGVTSGADYAFVVQGFTVPQNVTSATITVIWKLVSTLSLAFTFIEVIVYDATNNQTVYWYNTTISTSNTYTTTTLTMNAALYTTNQYYFYVGIYVYQLLAIQGTVDFRVDYANIELSGLYPSFSGELVRINATQNATARLVITSYYVVGEWNGTITLAGDNSSAITFSSSQPDRLATDWVFLAVQTNPLYVSGSVDASFLTNTTGNRLDIYGYIEYRVGGALVVYPVEFHLTS